MAVDTATPIDVDGSVVDATFIVLSFRGVRGGWSGQTLAVEIIWQEISHLDVVK